MNDLVEVGWLGKAHGLKGEIKVAISEYYEDDLLRAESIHVGEPPVPYFIERIRGGGAIIVKLEELDTREQIALLSNRPLFLMSSQVTAAEEPTEETPFDALIGFSIEAEGYPTLGPITGVMDLPDHYLAELEHAGRELIVPLHENLITSVDADKRIVRMTLPVGLLDM